MGPRLQFYRGRAGMALDFYITGMPVYTIQWLQYKMGYIRGGMVEIFVGVSCFLMGCRGGAGSKCFLVGFRGFWLDFVVLGGCFVFCFCGLGLDLFFFSAYFVMIPSRYPLRPFRQPHLHRQGENKSQLNGEREEIKENCYSCGPCDALSICT